MYKKIIAILVVFSMLFVLLSACNQNEPVVQPNDDNIHENEDVVPDPDFSARTMFLMAVATSIDALAVGVSFAVLSVDIWSAVTIIGITTFLLSVVGLKIGNIFGSRYKNKAEFLGGAILLTLGVKILIEHTCL